MSEKKLKTGDVVQWVVVDREYVTLDYADSRNEARESARALDATNHIFAPHRIAKVVLAK